MTTRTVPIPPAFIALSAISMLFLAGGFLGLFVPDLVPPLASPKVAWSLIAVALVMDGAAVMNLVMGLKERARGGARMNGAR